VGAILNFRYSAELLNFHKPLFIYALSAPRFNQGVFFRCRNTIISAYHALNMIFPLRNAFMNDFVRQFKFRLLGYGVNEKARFLSKKIAEALRKRTINFSEVNALHSVTVGLEW